MYHITERLSRKIFRNLSKEKQKNRLTFPAVCGKVLAMKRNDVVERATELVGGFSKPSKMPCLSWSISAKRCKTGAKLVKVKGSICSTCYALKGNYGFPIVKAAHERRFQSLQSPQWTSAMIVAIRGNESSGFFRWHDSGDLQSLEHFKKLVEIARALPDIKFWLPTREYSIIASFLRTDSMPENLIVRLSAYMLEGEPPALAKRLGLTTSGVTKTGFTCPASNQGGKCLTCRACWSKDVLNVNYKKH